jgi:hypothetical protein
VKKKASGTFRARLNARGYEQVDDEHYDEDSKFAPVVSRATIHTHIDHHGWMVGRVIGREGRSFIWDL